MTCYNPILVLKTSKANTWEIYFGESEVCAAEIKTEDASAHQPIPNPVRSTKTRKPSEGPKEAEFLPDHPDPHPAPQTQ